MIKCLLFERFDYLWVAKRKVSCALSVKLFFKVVCLCLGSNGCNVTLRARFSSAVSVYAISLKIGFLAKCLTIT